MNLLNPIHQQSANFPAGAREQSFVPKNRYVLVPPSQVDRLTSRPHLGRGNPLPIKIVPPKVGQFFKRFQGEDILDPLQKVRVAFIRPSGRGQEAVLFELVEPAGGNSPVDGFLRRGGGLHHVCFEVEDIEAELDSVRMRGGLMARSPMPAAAFSGRRIAWVYTRRRLLIEYLEK